MDPPYTTSDFVSGMLTLAAPLPPNFNGNVTPIAFSFTDGHLTIEAAALAFFQFQTGPSGEIVFWHIILNGAAAGGQIETESLAGGAGDNAFILQPFATASNDGPPGIWATWQACRTRGLPYH